MSVGIGTLGNVTDIGFRYGDVDNTCPTLRFLDHAETAYRH